MTRRRKGREKVGRGEGGVRKKINLGEVWGKGGPKGGREKKETKRE